ncbi:hypothetical protein CF326_g6062 [Tilletia indica]|nr:hypothetical protein CF326_g6062 [Tilletia indica]
MHEEDQKQVPARQSKIMEETLSTRTSGTCRQDAVRQVWHTPELAIKIFSYMAREQIDLLTFSTVCKLFRALALPLLVHSLDIPLPRAPLFISIFRSNPELATFVKFLRIWQGIGDDSEQKSDNWWSEATALIKLIITNRARESLPLFDFTICISSIMDFSKALQHVLIAERIAALRVVVSDKVEPEVDEDPIAWQRYVDLYTARWCQLALTMADICKPTTRPALRLFHMEDTATEDTSHWWIGRETWETLGDVLPAMVEDLALRLSMDEEDQDRACTLLGMNWPHLRSFRLAATETGLMDWDRIHGAIDAFLDRHPHLEDIRISAPNFFAPVPLYQNFPALKRCSIDKTNIAHLGSFLSRHFVTLVDLKVPVLDLIDDPRDLVPDPSTIPNLDALRASPKIAAEFVARGGKIRHYEFETTQMIEELELCDWLIPLQVAAEAATCFDIRVDRQSMEQAITKLEQMLPAAAFPNLTELALCVIKDSEESRTWMELISALLAATKHHHSLRALRIECSRALSETSEILLDLEDDSAIPPRLEYLTCCSAASHPQHYRVLILPSNPSSSTRDTWTKGQGGKLRLQKLPASFRSRVDERGVWEQPRPSRDGNTIFKHSYDPHRLFE